MHFKYSLTYSRQAACWSETLKRPKSMSIMIHWLFKWWLTSYTRWPSRWPLSRSWKTAGSDWSESNTCQRINASTIPSFDEVIISRWWVCSDRWAPLVHVIDHHGNSEKKLCFFLWQCISRNIITWQSSILFWMKVDVAVHFHGDETLHVWVWCYFLRRRVILQWLKPRMLSQQYQM